MTPAADDAEPGFMHRFEPGDTEVAPLLLLHGTGGNEHDLVQLGRAISPRAPLLSPRGKVLENGMPRFFRRLAEGVFDVPDLIARTHELATFVRDASARYRLDAAKMYAVGFSNGANIAASLFLLHPGLLRGGVLLRAMVPFEPEPRVALAGTRILLSEGRLDPLIPPASGERLAAIFREAGADVELAWQQAGHGLVGEDVAAATRWLAA